MMTPRISIGAAVALAMTAAGFAGAEEDTTAGSSVRPPADTVGAASTEAETAVPAEKRETRADSDLPGDTMEHVDEHSGPQPTAPDQAEDTSTAAEEQAAMARTEENEKAVHRYIESLSEQNGGPADAPDDEK